MPRLPQATKLEIQCFEDLLPWLNGMVFHVTTPGAANAIEASGHIEPNTTGISSPFGNTSNGYFRNRGCVSLFDYRACGSPEWNEHSHKCLPTLPLTASDPIVILFLRAHEFAKLLPWSLWKEEEAWSQRVVPHIEVGYPGKLTVSAIDRVLFISQCQT